MCVNTVDVKAKISETILSMEKPFKLSQLYLTLEENGITDKYMILDVLNQLYESGMVDKTDVEDDTPEYKSNFKN